jgi:hypothetical protein
MFDTRWYDAMATAHENETDRQVEDLCQPAAAALIVPFNGGRPVNELLIFGVTQDYSRHGMSLILAGQITGDDELLIGFWCDGPMLMRGEVCTERCLGGGFWQYGVHFRSTVQPRQIEGSEYVVKCLKRLNPDSEIQFSEVSSNRRGNCRMSAVATAEKAVLITAMREIPAKIVNESATGFLVAIPAQRPFEKGTTLTLDTINGIWQTEVARCEPAGKELHVGLRRLYDAPPRTAGPLHYVLLAIFMLLAGAIYFALR